MLVLKGGSGWLRNQLDVSSLRWDNGRQTDLRRRRTMIRKFVLSAILIVVFTANVPTTHAAGVVTNCSNDTDFSNKIAGGGLVTFNCGGVNASATIILSSPKT